MAVYFNPYIPTVQAPYAVNGQSYNYGQYGQTAPANDMMYRPENRIPDPSSLGIRWVEGEIGAKAFQMPAGWPANLPIALWDNSDMVIYLKSWNAMGMPNPMQKLRYNPEQEAQQILPDRLSGASNPSEIAAPTQEYATKEEVQTILQEIRNLKETMTKPTSAETIQHTYSTNYTNQNGTKKPVVNQINGGAR